MAFDPSSLPKNMYEAYKGGPLMWPVVVQKGVESGIKDVDFLASVVFYLHHPQRNGRPIATDETAMIEQWKGFRTLIKPMVPGMAKPKPPSPTPPSGPAPATDWYADEAIKEDFGREVYDWARIAPYGTQTREFTAPAFLKGDYKAIFVWKSGDPDKACPANPDQRVQILAMLRDDLPYWERRAPDSRVGSRVLQAAQAAAIKDYRELIVYRKMCPRGAFLKLYQQSQDMIYKMMIGMFQFMPFRGLAGAPISPTARGISYGIRKIVEWIESED